MDTLVRIQTNLRSLLFRISSGGIFQGRFLGRQSNTSWENSEKSTSYSIRMPSVSGSISPAWPRVLASRLRGTTEREKRFSRRSQRSRKNKMRNLKTKLNTLPYAPFRKSAVVRPVGDITDEQSVDVVPWTEAEVVRTVRERDINPWNPMVHRGEHRKGLVGKDL